MLRRCSRWNNHGQNHVTPFLARSIPHYATDRLHHIDLRVAGGQEQDSIQSRDIHSFGEATDIGQHPTGLVRGFLFQPGEFAFLFAGIHPAIDVFRFAGQACFWLDTVLLLIFFHHLLEHVGNLDGTDFVSASFVVRRDNLTERHSPFHGVRVFDTVL